MPIGYANFSTIQQGNQQVVNSMANLGQQIGNAIETHAATQSAQAMLPMLQQQYKQGLEKISTGDAAGLGDVYQASMIASQNPLLAPMASHAVNLANHANIQAQHNLRTQAYLGGRMATLYGQYGSGLMSAPAGMNPDWAGKQNQAKSLNPAQQMSAMANFNKIDNDLATKQSDALRLGDQASYQQLGQQRQQLRDTLSQGGMNAPALPAYTSSFEVADQLSQAQKELKAEKAKGTGHWFGKNTDPKVVNELQQKIQQLQGSQLPSAQGAGMPTGQWKAPNVPDSAVKYLLQNPSAADQFDAKYGKGMAAQILKPQTSMDQQASPMSPEEQDESQAVEGVEEEPTSNDQNPMVS